MDDCFEFSAGSGYRLKTKLGPSGGGALVKPFTNIHVACFCARKFLLERFRSSNHLFDLVPDSQELFVFVRFSLLYFFKKLFEASVKEDANIFSL